MLGTRGFYKHLIILTLIFFVFGSAYSYSDNCGQILSQNIPSQALNIKDFNFDPRNFKNSKEARSYFLNYLHATRNWILTHPHKSPLDIPTAELAPLRKLILDELKSTNILGLGFSYPYSSANYTSLENFKQHRTELFEPPVIEGWAKHKIDFLGAKVRDTEVLSVNSLVNFRRLLINGFESLDENYPERASFFNLFFFLGHFWGHYFDYSKYYTHPKMKLLLSSLLQKSDDLYWALRFGIDAFELQSVLNIMPFIAIDYTQGRQTQLKDIQNLAGLSVGYFRYLASDKLAIHSIVHNTSQDILHDLGHFKSVLWTNDFLSSHVSELPALDLNWIYLSDREWDQALSRYPWNLNWYDQILSKVHSIKDKKLKKYVRLFIQTWVFENPRALDIKSIKIRYPLLSELQKTRAAIVTRESPYTIQELGEPGYEIERVLIGIESMAFGKDLTNDFYNFNSNGKKATNESQDKTLSRGIEQLVNAHQWLSKHLLKVKP